MLGCSSLRLLANLSRWHGIISALSRYMRPHRCAFWIRTYTLLSLSFAVYHKNINCTFTKSAPSSLFSFLKLHRVHGQARRRVPSRPKTGSESLRCATYWTRCCESCTLSWLPPATRTRTCTLTGVCSHPYPSLQQSILTLFNILN